MGFSEPFEVKIRSAAGKLAVPPDPKKPQGECFGGLGGPAPQIGPQKRPVGVKTAGFGGFVAGLGGNRPEFFSSREGRGPPVGREGEALRGFRGQSPPVGERA